jgi:hypothetical protein
LPDAAVALDTVEVELKVTHVAVTEIDFDFGQRVDALDQVLVGALAPQQPHVFHRRVERLLGHEPEQQVVE